MGNTFSHYHLLTQSSVHPHTHGEHSCLFPSLGSLHGSSPHAWGTPTSGSPCGPRPRFIPTRMGNTDSVGFDILSIPVHPHTHGEHRTSSHTRWGWVGSSPHAWGTLCCSCIIQNLCRFIPTRMGNTLEINHHIEGKPVHPHTHGEHTLAVDPLAFATGSSPHAWGTPGTRPAHGYL